MLALVRPLLSVVPGPESRLTVSPVQVPVSCAPGTGLPLLDSRVRLTLPPVPPSDDGEASRTRLPPALIGIATDALLPAA